MNPDVQSTIDKANSQIAGINKSAGTSIPVITATGLQNAPKPMNIPPVPPPTETHALSGLIQNTSDTFANQLANNTSTAKSAEATSLESLIQAMTSGGQAQFEDQAYKDAGVDTAQQGLNDTNNAILAEQNALRRRVDALQSNPEGFVGNGLKTEVDRLTNESLSKQADLAIIQLSKQGAYDSAKAIADRAVAAQTEAQQNKIQALQAIYEANKDEFTTAEQQQFESAQAQRNSELDTKKQMLLADYDAKIKQNDPLYQAQLKAANAQNTPLSNDPANAPLINAYNSVAAGIAPVKQKQVAAVFNQYLASGDTDGAKNYLVRLAVSNLPTDQQNQAVGRSQALAALNDVQSLLDQAKQQGVNTNLLTGKLTKVSQNLGTTNNPDLTYIGSRIQQELQVYRRAMTGVAFSPGEAAQYSAIFPDITNTDQLNTTKIGALTDALNSNNRATLAFYIGEDNYNSLFGKPETANLPSNSGSSSGLVQVRDTDDSGRITNGSIGGLNFTVSY